MVKKNKTWMVLITIMMALTAILSGCGARSQQAAPASTTSTDAAKATTTATTPAKKIIIKFSHVVAEDTPKGKAAVMFKKLAEKYTNGRVEVQVFPNGQLYDDNQVLAAVQQNNVQMAAPATSKVSKLFPQWSIFDLPFAFPDVKSVQKAMESKQIGGKLFTMLKSKQLLGLAMWDNGFKQMTLNDHALIKPSDFAGKKFRVMPSKVLQDQFRAVGANPVPMAFSEVYSALEQGVIDGEENTLSNIYSKKFYEVQKYMTISNHGYLGYAVITNAKFWDGLPSDIRQELEKALNETTQWVRDNAQSINQDNLEKIKASGKIKIHVLTPEERKAWMEKMDPIYSQYKDIIGADLINAVQALRK